MLKIEVYSKNICPYCVKAKQLLKLKGVEDSIIEYNIETNQEKLKEMLTRSGGRKTVPQIFINDVHIGGCDDLYAMDTAGKLDALLKQ